MNSTTLFLYFDLLQLHRFLTLSAHPSRRIRYLCASLHERLVNSEVVKAKIIEEASPEVIGAWCLSAFDIDRAVTARSSQTWKAVEVDDELLKQSIIPFVVKNVVEPSGAHDPEMESLEDRNARLRVGALGAMKWIVGVLAHPLLNFFSYMKSRIILSCRAFTVSVRITGVLERVILRRASVLPTGR